MSSGWAQLARNSTAPPTRANNWRSGPSRAQSGQPRAASSAVCSRPRLELGAGQSVVIQLKIRRRHSIIPRLGFCARRALSTGTSGWSAPCERPARQSSATEDEESELRRAGLGASSSPTGRQQTSSASRIGETKRNRRQTDDDGRRLLLSRADPLASQKWALGSEAESDSGHLLLRRASWFAGRPAAAPIGPSSSRSGAGLVLIRRPLFASKRPRRVTKRKGWRQPSHHQARSKKPGDGSNRPAP